MSGSPGERGEIVRMGAHSVRVEPPDLVHIVFGGELSTSEFTAMRGELHRFAEGKERIFILVDMRRGSWISPDARKAGMDAPVNIRGVAFVSTSFSLRALATLLSKAFMLLHPEADLATAFCESEAEARTWLDRRRRSLERQAGRSLA